MIAPRPRTFLSMNAASPSVSAAWDARRRFCRFVFANGRSTRLNKDDIAEVIAAGHDVRWAKDSTDA